MKQYKARRAIEQAHSQMRQKCINHWLAETTNQISQGVMKANDEFANHGCPFRFFDYVKTASRVAYQLIRANEPHYVAPDILNFLYDADDDLIAINSSLVCSVPPVPHNQATELWACEIARAAHSRAAPRVGLSSETAQK